MNHEKIYNQIIDRARNEMRIKGNDIYYERHHVIPKCLGGTNDKDNLVLLTAREHFICHKLLVEIYPDNKKLIFALWGMCNQNKNGLRYNVTNRTYEDVRIKFSNSIRGYKHPPRSEKTKRLLSAAKKGKTYDELYGENGDAKRIAHSMAMTGKTHSESTKLKIGLANKGKRRSEEFKKTLRVPKSAAHRAALSKPRRKITCPHCGKNGGSNNMHRYHFDKCKYKKYEG